MRDLIATQSLDSLTARLLGGCCGNWFFEKSTAGKTGPTIMLCCRYPPALISWSVRIGAVQWFLMKATSVSQAQHNLVSTSTIRLPFVLCKNLGRGGFSDLLLLHIHLAAKFLRPFIRHGHAAIFRGQLFCPPSAWPNSFTTFTKTRLPQHSSRIADQLSSCPQSSAAILNRYRIRWPSRCLMPC